MEQIEECNGFKIIIIREESGKLIGARCTYCTNRYPRKAHLIRHCNSAHVGLLQTSVSDSVNAFHEADDEAEKQRLAALHVAALAAEAETQRLAALHVAALAEAETQRLAALQVATLAEETEKQRLAALAEETEKQRLAELAEEAEKQRLTALHHAALAEEAEKQRLTALREKQRVLQAEAEKQRINAIKEAEEAEKQRIIALKEAEETEKQRIIALKEAEEAEQQRIIVLKEAETQRLAAYDPVKERITYLYGAEFYELYKEADITEQTLMRESMNHLMVDLHVKDKNWKMQRESYIENLKHKRLLERIEGGEPFILKQKYEFLKKNMGHRKTERRMNKECEATVKAHIRAKILKKPYNPSNNKTMRMKIRKMIL